MSRIEPKDRFNPRPRPETGPASAIQHYVDLARHHLRLIIGVTLAAGLLATMLAVMQLQTAALYRASAKVTVQPTDAEMAFTQVYVRSSNYDTSNVVTQSHIEYLLSREVAERTFDAMVERYGEGPPRAEPSLIATAISKIKLAIRATLRYLNSGEFIRVTGKEEIIGAIQQSVEVNLIESSFIMEIGVYWDDPQIAADIANTLAVVYQDRVKEQMASSTAQLEAFLQTRRQEVQSAIDGLVDREISYLRERNIIDFRTEQDALLTRISALEADIAADRAALRSSQAVVQALSPQETESRRGGLDETTEVELSLARVNIVELTQQITESEQTLRALQLDIMRYASSEKELGEIAAAMLREQARLADIDERLLTTQMNEAESLQRLRIIDAARPPLYPDNPKVLKRLAFGLAAGLALAIGLVLARDMMSSRLISRADFADVTGLRVIDTSDTSRDKGPTWKGWSALNTARDLVVLDWSDPERGEKIAREIVGQTPSKPEVWCGLAQNAHWDGYLNADIDAVLIAVGPDEVDGAEFSEDIAALRRLAPYAQFAVAIATKPAVVAKPEQKSLLLARS